jgi:hypothetical protein
VIPDRSARRSPSRHAVAAVLVAAMVLVLAGGGPPSHRHGTVDPGLYDERCVLASLDSLRVDTVIPVGVSAICPTEVSGPTSTPLADVCRSPVPPAGSRSPPTS